MSEVSPKMLQACARAWRKRVETAEAEAAKLRAALEAVNAATYSHVDGRDLLAELHPRKQIDIVRRLDAKETWFEGDWLSRLYEAMKVARQALSGSPDPVAEAERAVVEAVDADWHRPTAIRLQALLKIYGNLAKLQGKGESDD
ncbi:MAG: hypothetical protein ACR2QC_07860 [Gammaproteobacteria bacterium]